MKKLFFALMAVCALTFGLTSCSSFADPDVYPVSGHTFVFENDTMTTTLEFQETWFALLETKLEGRAEPIQQPYRWSMSGNNVQLKTIGTTTYKFSDGTTKTLGAGAVVLEGPYDAAKRTLYLQSRVIQGDDILMTQKD